MAIVNDELRIHSTFHIQQSTFKNMKKEYTKASMKVVKLKKAPAILAGSTYPKGYSGEFGAPEFNDIPEM